MVPAGVCLEQGFGVWQHRSAMRGPSSGWQITRGPASSLTALDRAGLKADREQREQRRRRAFA